MEATETLPETPPVEWAPSQAQRNREKALRRFNALFVYGPLGLGVLIVLGLLGWLFWAAVLPQSFTGADTAGARGLASGLADTIFILMALPWALLCPLLPIAFIAGIFYSRRQGHAPLRRLQHLFWRLDGFLHQIDAKVNEFAPRIAQAVTAGNATITRLTTTAARLVQPKATPPTEQQTTTPNHTQDT